MKSIFITLVLSVTIVMLSCSESSVSSKKHDGQGNILTENDSGNQFADFSFGKDMQETIPNDWVGDFNAEISDQASDKITQPDQAETVEAKKD